jgi:hypothetical protein
LTFRELAAALLERARGSSRKEEQSDAHHPAREEDSRSPWMLAKMIEIDQGKA